MIWHTPSKKERNIKTNLQLEFILLSISNELSIEEIECQSRIKTRGKYSKNSRGFELTS